MPNVIKTGIALSVAIFLTGCGVTVKPSVQVRERVDMDMPGQSASNQVKKTRKIYVVEVSRTAKDKKQTAGVAPAQAGQEPAAVNPFVDGFADYQVRKDDTLQKISKQFYDSYNQWPKIYEANKDKIRNPNFLKPGIVLKVPAP